MIAILWALFAHLALGRFLVPDSIVAFVLRVLVVHFYWHHVKHKGLAVGGLFLVPATALLINHDFLFIFSRLTVCSAILLWLAVVGVEKRPRLSQVLYVTGLAVWGFYLCHGIVDAGRGFSGWYDNYVHGDLLPLVTDDGQNYIELGRNLLRALKTMYRPAGYPLVTRLLTTVFVQNLHVLRIFNVLCLMLSAHLVSGFARRIANQAWVRPLAFAAVAVYLSGFRLESYRGVLTDPLNDLCLLLHLICLYNYLGDNSKLWLKRTWLTLLIAFFLRPTILYYSFALAAVLSLRAWWKRGALLEPLRPFALILCLPLVLLVTEHRLVHGVFSYSSMPSQIFAYRTYATMLMVRDGISNSSDARERVEHELTDWRQSHQAEGAHLSNEGKMAVIDKAFAIAQFRAAPKLLLQALEAGFTSLLPTPDLMLVLLALLVGVYGGWWCLLLWPLYLIVVYSFEGLGMEYRLTLQVTIPCLLVILAQVGRWLSPFLPLSDPPVLHLPEIRRAWVVGPLLALALVLVATETSAAGSSDELGADLRDHAVVATAWSDGQLKYRRVEDWGRLSTRTLPLPETAIEALRGQDLLPLTYWRTVLPHRAERSARVGDDFKPVLQQEWSIDLNGFRLGRLRREVSQSPQFSHERLRFEPRIGSFFAGFDVDLSSECRPVFEQLRTIDGIDDSVYTTAYDASEWHTWSDQFQLLRGTETRERKLSPAGEPASQTLCRFLTSGGQAGERWPIQTMTDAFVLQKTGSDGSTVTTTIDKVPGLSLKWGFQAGALHSLIAHYGPARLHIVATDMERR